MLGMQWGEEEAREQVLVKKDWQAQDEERRVLAFLTLVHPLALHQAGSALLSVETGEG